MDTVLISGGRGHVTRPSHHDLSQLPALRRGDLVDEFEVDLEALGADGAPGALEEIVVDRVPVESRQRDDPEQEAIRSTLDTLEGGDSLGA